MPVQTGNLAHGIRGNANRIAFASAHDGWLYDPGLFVTHDGGRSWTDSQPASDILAVVPAGKDVWAIERPCGPPPPSLLPLCDERLLVSDDAGRTWHAAPAQPPQTALVGELLRPTASEAWLIGTTVAHTRDDGQHWHNLPPLPCRSIRAPFPLFEPLANIASGRPWLVCLSNLTNAAENRAYCTSDNSGQTWDLLNPDDRGQPFCCGGYARSLAAVTQDTAFLGSERGSVERSDDGGLSWRPVILDLQAWKIAFADPQRGWVLLHDDAPGTQGTVGRTDDGGVTWDRVVLP